MVAVLLVAVAAAGLLLCAGYARASRLQAWPEMLLPWRLAAEKALPFEIRVPNTSTIRAMEDVNVGTLESFESVTSLMASIDENN